LGRILGSPGGVSELADAHRFLQQRVTLYVKTLFFFSGSFAILGAIKVLVLASSGRSDWARIAGAGNLMIVGLTVTLAGGWLYVRRDLRPALALHVLESAGTVIGCAFLAAIIHVLPEGFPVPVELSLTLLMVLALVIRAAIVPSMASRTLVVGLLATATLTAPSLRRGLAVDPQADFTAHYMWLGVFGWGAIFSVATMIVSRVIYGLQERVREAMQLGSYTLEQKLGEGGMGIVYRARHAMLRRPTAVKLLPPETAGERTVARFEREVQLTAELTHPNTVTVFDYGRTPEGVFYYAMELLEGASLEDVVAVDGAQAPERVIHVLHQVAGALAEAHGIGLIHRDIKPANIILCEQGGVPDVPKVLDFGLVKDMTGGGGVALTKAEDITGTPLYLPPEAIKAPAAVDARSDLYALGAVGYFLLSGDHVFTGTTLVEVCSHHLHSTPVSPSERLGRSVPADLEAVILGCLEKDPAGRPQTAAALRARLARTQAFGGWDAERARRWWSENAEGLRARRASAAAAVERGAAATAPSARGLLSVDAEARGL
jgi:serine/threonine-protein kinase